MAPKAKAKIVKDVTQVVLARRTRMCNFLEYKGESPPAMAKLRSRALMDRPGKTKRHQGRISTLRLLVLHLRHRVSRQ